MSNDSLWSGPSDLDDPVRRRRATAGDSADAQRHIGCPLGWFKRVFTVVRGKNELAVALYIYRLRSVRRSRTITLSNARLLAELGVDRYAKYRALRRLADAGIITLKRQGRRALEISFQGDEVA